LLLLRLLPLLLPMLLLLLLLLRVLVLLQSPSKLFIADRDGLGYWVPSLHCRGTGCAREGKLIRAYGSKRSSSMEHPVAMHCVSTHACDDTGRGRRTQWRLLLAKAPPRLHLFGPLQSRSHLFVGLTPKQ